MKSPAKMLKTTAAAFGLARRESDPEHIEGAITDARAMIAEGEREEAVAQESYRESLLTDDGRPETHLAAGMQAKIKRDRGTAMVEELTARLAAVRDAEERASRKAVHDDAVAKCDAIRARLPEEYRYHANALRELLRDLAEAELARKLAEPLEEEFGPIASVEREPRGLDGIPEEIIEQTVVKLWTIDGRPQPLPAERQREVQVHPETGRGQLLSKDGGAGFTCSRYEYTHTRYREAIGSPGGNGSLLRSVHLPAFHAYGDDFVTAEGSRSADTALNHLSLPLRERPEIERPVRERLELVTEARGDGARIASPLRSVA